MSAASTSTDFRSNLIGAWGLVSYRCEPVDNSIETFYPMTKEPEGIIMYTPDGYMSAQLMTPGTPPFADGDLSGGTTKELATAAKNYLAYSGPFTVSEKNGEPRLNHTMQVSSFPNWLGNTQVRVAELTGTKLELQSDGPIMVEGILAQPILNWNRMPAYYV